MTPSLPLRSFYSIRLASLVCAGLLAGCVTAPDTRIIPGKKYREVFEGPVVVEYVWDTKLSALDGKSCYAFMSGWLVNQSRQRLSRQTEVHVQVYHEGRLLFRDYTRLRADLPPENRVQLQLIESPLHNKACPSYDRVDVSLKKIVLH